MKKSLLFVLSLILALPLFAQDPSNISVKDISIKYKYRVMPKSPQDPLFFNYGVKVEMTPAAKALYEEATIKNRLKIEGQNRIENATENDYLLTLTLDNLMIVSSSVQADGPAGSSYNVFISYTFGSKIRFAKGDKVLDDSPIFSPSQENRYFTKSYKTAAEANAYWINNKDNIKNEILQKAIEESISGSNRYLSMKYGFFINDGSGYIKTMNEKKHSENVAMNEKSSALADKLKTLDGTTPLAEDELSDYITYFKGLPEKYTTASKADSKIRYIAYFNLCMTYLLMDQPAQAVTYADMIIKNGVDPKDGEKLKKQANELADIFAKSFFKARQFTTKQYFK